MSKHEPIGGDTKVFAVGETDYYDKDAGDFKTKQYAKVDMGDDITANDVGMVVDLLNEYGANEIRDFVLQNDSPSDNE